MFYANRMILRRVPGDERDLRSRSAQSARDDHPDDHPIVFTSFNRSVSGLCCPGAHNTFARNSAPVPRLCEPFRQRNNNAKGYAAADRAHGQRKQAPRSTSFLRCLCFGHCATNSVSQAPNTAAGWRNAAPAPFRSTERRSVPVSRVSATSPASRSSRSKAWISRDAASGSAGLDRTSGRRNAATARPARSCRPFRFSN